MQCFQLIRKVLDEIYNNDLEGTEAEKDQAICEKLEKITDEYKNFQKGVNIDFTNPVSRFAYILKYVSCHADFVCKILKMSFRSAYFKKPNLIISCIGGGPGSDLLGILKYMEGLPLPTGSKTFCHLIDKEMLWSECWGDVYQLLDQTCDFSVTYLPLDVTDEKSWRPAKKYLKADVFAFVYFLSEIYKCKSVANDYMEHLFKKAKSGSLFVFLDNRTSSIYGWFDDLINANSLTVLESDKRTLRMNSSEEKTELGVYYNKFQNLKLSASIAYRVAVKP